MSTGPNLIIVAGPNGAGKTTAAADILVGALAVQEFVNADIIAKGLSSFPPLTGQFCRNLSFQRKRHRIRLIGRLTAD